MIRGVLNSDVKTAAVISGGGRMQLKRLLKLRIVQVYERCRAPASDGDAAPASSGRSWLVPWLPPAQQPGMQF